MTFSYWQSKRPGPGVNLSIDLPPSESGVYYQQEESNTQVIEFLGLTVDTASMELYLPGDKLKRIWVEAQKLGGRGGRISVSSGLGQTDRENESNQSGNPSISSLLLSPPVRLNSCTEQQWSVL